MVLFFKVRVRVRVRVRVGKHTHFPFHATFYPYEVW
jgi:hypothetical protein